MADKIDKKQQKAKANKSNKKNSKNLECAREICQDSNCGDDCK